MAGLRDKVASGVIWATVEKFAVQLSGFVVGMVLARLLTPGDYGTVALLNIFFAVAGAFASCGFGNALVQRKNATELEFNSVFYLSVVVSCFIYIIFFIAAPYIAVFYGIPVLCPVTRVSAVTFIFNAINSVQSAELNRKMLFNCRCKISLISCAVSATAGITFAVLGLGVWAIVLSSVFSSLATLVAYWTIIAWRPKLMFSLSAVKPLFSYGWKLSLSGLIHIVYQNLSGFIIGRYYSPADLAYVNKGNSMPNLVMSSVDGTLRSVSFPALAQLQDDKVRLRDAMRRMIQCSTYLVFPSMAGLALCAKPVILALYGGQWEPSVPYVQLACLAFALGPFSTINTNAISAMGRSDVFLLLDCIKKSVGVILTLISLHYGIWTFMLTVTLVQEPFAVFVNTFANGKLLGYNIKMQFKDVLSSAIMTFVMGIAVYAFQYAIHPLLLFLPVATVSMLVEVLLSAVIGAIVYLWLSVIFKPQPFREYVSVVMPIIQKKSPRLAKGMERWR